MKEYPNIQKALQLEMLCADKENGIYLNEEFASSIEASLAKAYENEESLNALSEKLQQVEQQAKADAELAAKKAEEELNRTKTEYENVIAEIDAKLQKAEAALKDKEEELNAMAAAAVNPATPAKPTHSSSEEIQPWEGMSLAQKKVYFQNM